jgi:hypothetical protein
MMIGEARQEECLDLSKALFNGYRRTPEVIVSAGRGVAGLIGRITPIGAASASIANKYHWMMYAKCCGSTAPPAGLDRFGSGRTVTQDVPGWWAFSVT